jgi:mandelate racemase
VQERGGDQPPPLAVRHADLGAGHLRQLRRQQRALQRVRDLGLLAQQPRSVEREREPTGELVEALRAARRAGGGRVAVVVDYNQSLSVPEAVARGRALAAEGPAWIEEPVTAEDLAGHARVARELETPVQTGENWWGPRDLARAIEAQASDLVMLDVMKIGGVTGWLRAAALAEAHGLPVSSHLFPEVSAQLLAVTPTAHWLEYQDWASPVLREPLRVEGGMALPSDRPGSGVEWDEAAVRRHLLG